MRIRAVRKDGGRGSIIAELRKKPVIKLKRKYQPLNPRNVS